MRGEDARVEGDVLNENRNFLAFDVDDFNGATVGGEWLVPLGEYFEAGAGVELLAAHRAVASTQTSSTTTAPRSSRTCGCGIVPVAFTVRVLPLGQTSPRAAVLRRRARHLQLALQRDRASSSTSAAAARSSATSSSPSGNETGPVALGGIRFAGDTRERAAFEVRYHSADADLGTTVLDRR